MKIEITKEELKSVLKSLIADYTGYLYKEHGSHYEEYYSFEGFIDWLMSN